MKILHILPSPHLSPILKSIFLTIIMNFVNDLNKYQFLVQL